MTHEHLRVNILVDEQSTYLFIRLCEKFGCQNFMDSQCV